MRFTGQWPTPTVWDEHPNWEYALNEGGVPGQDESTLRPAEENDIIGPDVAYTAGELTQADGRGLPALIEMDHGRPVGIFAFVTRESVWAVRELGMPPRWQPVSPDWIPKQESQLAVSLDDSSVFPAVVRFKLPHNLGEDSRKFRIDADGTFHEWTG